MCVSERHHTVSKLPKSAFAMILLYNFKHYWKINDLRDTSANKASNFGNFN